VAVGKLKVLFELLCVCGIATVSGANTKSTIGVTQQKRHQEPDADKKKLPKQNICTAASI